MRENILIIVNQLLANTWLIVLLGLIHIKIIEANNIWQFYKQKKWILLLPAAKRCLYLILGLILIFSSFSLVDSLIKLFVPGSMLAMNDNMQVEGLRAYIKDQAEYVGIFAVIGFIFSGIALTLSGGGRWLVNLSKLFATITVLYLFIGVLIRYALIIYS